MSFILKLETRIRFTFRLIQFNRDHIVCFQCFLLKISESYIYPLLQLDSIYKDVFVLNVVQIKTDLIAMSNQELVLFEQLTHQKKRIFIFRFFNLYQLPMLDFA